MKCPHCNQEHPDSLIECPSTGKMLKRACTNKACSYFGEHIWPLEKETCPCCGRSLINTHQGHEFVDLGLSVKWAICNIGAKTPEGYGDYFAWGETSPKSNYEWYNLKYCDDNYGYRFSKYNLRDNRTVLEINDDAAHENWGGNWRMPTYEEWKELNENCTWTWSAQNGVEGYKVTSKKPGHTSNFIFLPAAGYRHGTYLKFAGSEGNYWSSLKPYAEPYRAYRRYFLSDSVWTDHGCRPCGYSVRPVLE